MGEEQYNNISEGGHNGFYINFQRPPPAGRTLAKLGKCPLLAGVRWIKALNWHYAHPQQYIHETIPILQQRHPIRRQQPESTAPSI